MSSAFYSTSFLSQVLNLFKRFIELFIHEDILYMEHFNGFRYALCRMLKIIFKYIKKNY